MKPFTTPRSPEALRAQGGDHRHIGERIYISNTGEDTEPVTAAPETPEPYEAVVPRVDAAALDQLLAASGVTVEEVVIPLDEEPGKRQG